MLVLKRKIELRFNPLSSLKGKTFSLKNPKQNIGFPLLFSKSFFPSRQTLYFSTKNDNANLNRKEIFPEFIKKFGPLYSNKFQISHSLKELRDLYGTLNREEQKEKVSCVGRIRSKRISGKYLFFYDLEGDGSFLQVVASKQNYANDSLFSLLHTTLKRGDIIHVSGLIGKTKSGELSIFASDIRLLSPCLHDIPKELKDLDTRFKKRYLDLLVNHTSKEILFVRSQIIRYIRSFFDSRGFIEVETPVLSTSFGGATAQTFQTTSHSLSHFHSNPINLFLRISPELYLKQLIIGGFEKVYEIGKQFRNEGIDSSHNPEFTTCEFYQAYSNYNEIMKMTEDLISGMVKSLFKTHIIQLQTQNGLQNIDFTPPFKRINVIEELEKNVGSLPPLNENCLDWLLKTCGKYGISCPKPHTIPRLLDKIISHFVEGSCIQPTFVCNHPKLLSPLAKSCDNNPNFTERFELFINTMEVCNAYSELNDPEDQIQRFSQQLKFKEAGDQEIPPFNEIFIDALEYGLPPTGGWGMGIDRLCMILTNQNSIKEVITFPFKV